MTGGGQSHGSAGTYWNADEFNFPGVPFGHGDFNHKGQECHTESGNIEDYQNPEQVGGNKL